MGEPSINVTLKIQSLNRSELFLGQRDIVYFKWRCIHKHSPNAEKYEFWSGMLFTSSSARSLHRSTRIQHPYRVYLLFGILERVIFFIAFHGVSIDNCNWDLRVRGTRERQV